MTRIKKDKNKNRKKGFSIGEVMISAFIVSVVLVAMVNLIASSLKRSMDSRDHIIASQLAQEGVELVRNLRDNNWVDPVAPHDSFDSDEFPDENKDNCRIDKNNIDVESCGDGIDKTLYYDENDFYVHAAGTATKFQRKIELDYNTGDAATADNLTASSIVIWGGDFPADCTAANKCVYTQSVLTRWGE